MSGLSIDKPLQSGQRAKFIVDMSFYGYSKKLFFNIKVPRAAPLLSRVDNIIVESKAGTPKEKTKGNFGFSRYQKAGNIGSNFYLLKIRLNNEKDANQLTPGETVNFVSSDPKLAQLNNKNYEIIPDTNKNKKYINLKVNINHQPTTAASPANGSLQEITGIIKTRRYTVTIPNKVFKGLIAERIYGKQPKEGMIEDIPIYAYKRFRGSNTTNVKRKLMNNTDEVSDKEPPDRNTVSAFRGMKSYSRDFELDDNDKFIFYVAIARYIYDGEKWTKQWVQTDASDKVIWGKAVERKG